MNNILYDNLPLLVLTQLVSLLYIATTWLYGVDFFTANTKAKKLKQPVLALTVLVHIAYLGLLTSTEGYKSGYSTFNLMTMVALTLSTTYFLVVSTTKSDKTGFFILSFATGAEVISSFMTAQTHDLGQSFTGISIGVHLIAAIFSFSAIAISGIYSILYLLLFRQIQRNRFGLFFERLPSLEVLERLIMHSVAFGFIFISITILAGMIEMKNAGEAIALFEPRLLALIAIWAIYGISIFIRPLIGWDIKHMAYLFIILFVFITLLIVTMAIVSPAFHGKPV